jgi:hypothetical protein
MIGLQKIYLVNSYFKGLISKIECDGNTNCSGTNGAGKTTTLQLIPAFYGVNPETMVSRAADRDSFLDYYLPSPGSLLVFQYERGDGPCCSLMYRHSAGNKIAYRFIKCSADDVLFVSPWHDGFKAGKPVTQIFSAMKAQGMELSSQLDQIVDYRVVIQHDRQLLRERKSKGNKLFQMAMQYSIGGTDGCMTQMDHLTFAVLKRSKMFGRMKEMIVATQFHSHVPARPKHTANKSITDDLASIRDFINQEKKIRRCISKHRERLENRTCIRELASQLKMAQPELECKITQLKEKEASIIKEKNEASDDYQQKIEKLSHKKSVAKGDKAGLNKQIEEIHNKRNEWDTERIAVKITEFKRLADFENAEQAALRHLDSLSEAVSDHKRWHLEKLMDIREDFYNLRESIKPRQQSLEDECSKLTDQKDARLSQIDHQLEERKERTRGDYTEQREGLVTQKTIAETRAKEAGETEDETLRKAAAEQEVDVKRLIIERLEAEFEEARVHFEQAKNSQSLAVSTLENAQDYEEEITKNRGNILKQLYPADNSLLSFLRKEVGGYAENLGRVIDPRLLHRADLKPAVEINDGHENFYGLSIDVGVIEQPSHVASEERLQERLQEIEEKLKIAELERENKEGVLSQKNSDVGEKRNLLDSKKIELSSAKDNHEIAMNNLRQVRDDVATLISERRRAAVNNAKKYDGMISSIQKEHQESQIRMENNAHNHRSEAQSKYSIETSAISEKLTVLDDNLIQLAEDESAQKKEVEESYKARCINDGVDEAVLSQASERHRKAKSNHVRVRGYRNDVSEYELWEISEWSRLQDVIDEHAAKETEVLELERGIEAEKDIHQQFINTSRSKISNIRSSLHAENAKLTDINEVLGGVGKIPLDKNAVRPENISLTVQYLTNNLAKANTLQNEILNSITSISDELNQRTSSQVFEAWEMLQQGRLELMRTGNPNTERYDQNFLLSLPEDLSDLVENRIPEIHQSLILNFRSLGDQISNYYHDLTQLNREIGTVSNQLKDKINTGQKINALSDIEMKLVSKVDGVESWKELKTFSKEWDEWDIMSRNDLPPNSLEDSLAEVVRILETSHIKHDLSSLMDLEISLKENDRPLIIRSDDDLNNSSSNGLSYLAVIVIFIGMARYLCPNRDVTLTWPVDELATLHPSNVSLLFSMLKENNISMFSAMPGTDANLLRHFNHRLTLDQKKGVSIIPKTSQNLDRFKKLLDTQ